MTRTERIGDDVESANLERCEQVIEGIGIIAAARRLGPQLVAQQVARGIPRDQPEAIRKAGQLIAPMQRVRADAVEQQHRWEVDSSRLHITEAVAEITVA